MHQFRSESAIWRLRIAAFLVCMKCLLVPAGAAVLGYSIVIHDDDLTITALEMVLLTALVALLQWLVSQRTQCPLCMTPVLAAKSCAKHRRARTLFGSYRLRVAIAVLLRGRFHCPYCNERAELVLRKPRNH
jgi:hypothetical protein